MLTQPDKAVFELFPRALPGTDFVFHEDPTTKEITLEFWNDNIGTRPTILQLEGAELGGAKKVQIKEVRSNLRNHFTEEYDWKDMRHMNQIENGNTPSLNPAQRSTMLAEKRTKRQTSNTKIAIINSASTVADVMAVDTEVLI